MTHLTEHQVAVRLVISVNTVRAWRKTGYGPCFRKFGRAVRYSLTEVEAFEQAQTRRFLRLFGLEVRRRP